MGLGFSRKGPVGLKEGEKSEEHILHKRKPSFSGVVARQVWRAASQPCIWWRGTQTQETDLVWMFVLPLISWWAGASLTCVHLIDISCRLNALVFVSYSDQVVWSRESCRWVLKTGLKGRVGPTYGIALGLVLKKHRKPLRALSGIKVKVTQTIFVMCQCKGLLCMLSSKFTLLYISWKMIIFLIISFHSSFHSFHFYNCFLHIYGRFAFILLP